MLTRRQLRKIHGPGLPLHILELDYVESILLGGIYENTDKLVFKGGTCLRKAHGLNRFSEDLDFSVVDGDVMGDDVLAALESGIAAMENVEMTARLKEWKERPIGYLCKIQYEGPLFTGDARSRRSIGVDISSVPPSMVAEAVRVKTEYPGTGDYVLRCMNLKEVLTEKLRAMKQRAKPRDLYDMWFLLKKGVRTDREFLDFKFREVKHDPPTTLVEIVEDYPVGPDQWKRDIGQLILQVPDYDKIKEEAIEILSGW